MTLEQCLALRGSEEIHYTGRHNCRCTVGPRGGISLDIVRVRRSGAVKTWKTRPGEFRMPVKHGLYESGEITHANQGDFHLASECPALREAEKARA